MRVKKKGQIAILGFMIGVTIILLGLALAGPVQEGADLARNNTNGDTLGLDCGNSSISDFVKATCIVSDLSVWYFISAVIFIGGAAMAIKSFM